MVVIVVLFKFCEKEIKREDGCFVLLIQKSKEGNGCHCLAQVLQTRKEKQDNNNHCYHCH